MTLNDAVRELIRECDLTHVENNCIVLKDHKSCMTVHITEAPKPVWDITAIRLEPETCFPCIVKDWKQICDYLLIIKQESHHHAVFIELKKSMRDGAKDQLRSSLPILRYITSICKIEDNVNERIRVGYIIIAKKIRRFKPRTKEKKQVCIYRNEEIVEHKGIQIKMFIKKDKIPVRKLIMR